MPEVIPIIVDATEAAMAAGGEAAGAVGESVASAGDAVGEGVGAMTKGLGGVLPSMDSIGNVGMGLMGGMQAAQGIGQMINPPKMPSFPMGVGATQPYNPYNAPSAGGQGASPQQLAALAAAGSSANIGGLAPGYIRTQSQANAMNML